MARLIYAIDGDITGLINAVNQAKGLLSELNSQSSTIKFGTEGLQGLPATLANISSGITQIKASADSANVSLSFTKGVAALDQLGAKLAIITGNSQLFGASLKDQEAELSAYQAALNKLLSLGFAPLDADVTLLKTKIDALTASIAAQNAATIKTPVSTIVDKTQFTEPVIDVSTNTTGLSGADVLLRELNKDLAAGTISAREYAASVALIGQQTTSTNVKTEQQIGLLAGLNTQLAKLRGQRINIVDPADLAKQNARIQELEAEIARFGNVGKAGFDSSGVAVKNFGTRIGETRTPIENLGKGLTRSFTYLRELAFILPGIGIAGIFNLAFEAISKVADGLNLFGTKLTQVQSNLAAFNALNKDAAASIGKQIAPLKELYDATQNVNLSIEKRIEAAQQLRELYPDEFANATNLAIVNGQLKKSYDELTDSIIANAKSTAAQTQIAKEAEKAANAAFQIQKINNQRANEINPVKAVIAQGNVGTQQLQRTIDAANQRANVAIKPQQDIIDKSKNTITFLEGFVKTITETSSKLDVANKLLGKNLENFNNLLAKGGSKADFENIKKALELKLFALAPGDSQIAILREKIKQVEEIIKNAYDVKLTKGSRINPFDDLQKQLDEIILKSAGLAQGTGLKGYAADIQKITTAYTSLNNIIDAFNAKVKDTARKGKISQSDKTDFLSKTDSISSQLSTNELKALSDAQIAEGNRVSAELQRINDEFGIKSQESRDKELAGVDKLANEEIARKRAEVLTKLQIEANYQAALLAGKGNQKLLQDAEVQRDSEISQAQNAANFIKQINENSVVAKQAINQKYLIKEQELQDNITNIRNIALDVLGTKEENVTDKIISNWDKRIAEADKYFEALKRIAPEQKADFDAQQKALNDIVKIAKTKEISVELSKNFASAMQAGTNTFITGFFDSLSSLGKARQDIDDKYRQQYAAATDALTKQQIEQQRRIEQSATTSFGAVFSSLVSNAFQSFNKSIIDSFTKRLTENLGTTLIKPNTDQLGIKATGLDFSKTVISAGDAFRAQVDAAASSIAVKLNPGLLSGASGGGLAANAELEASSAGGQIAVAASEFNGEIDSAGSVFSSTVTGAAESAGAITGAAAATAGSKISSAGAGLSAKIAAAASGLSVVGGLVSGISSPTSAVGQGIGGALSGAGTGALIGSVVPGIGTAIGAAAGAIIGGISGIIGASKAKKQEDLQQKQVELQKETNELLARQNALAYTTSIIGRMTTQGIVTRADINSFGQLTATISGKDLQFVLDRSKNGR